MRAIATLGTLLVAGVLAVAVPAAAKPAHPVHPTTSHKNSSHTNPATSHKCTAHKVAFIASGTFDSWAAMQNTDGTWTGTIMINVTHTNHHAKGQNGPQTYNLNSTKVDFGQGANPPQNGDPVHLIGKITSVAKKCTDQSGAGTITVRKVDISTPKPKS